MSAHHSHRAPGVLLFGGILILWGLVLGWNGTAAGQTFPITIDPAAFPGTYFVSSAGITSPVSGVRVFNLAPGSYNVDIGMAGSCSRKAFVVTATGTVANSPNNDSSGAFEFDGGTVRFKNATIQFDPGQFQGAIWVQINAGNIAVGQLDPPGSLVLVPDNTYRIRLPYFVSSHVVFRVSATGQVEAPITPCVIPNVTVDANDALNFAGNTVQFRNTIVRLDPRQYVGNYTFPAMKTGPATPWVTGPRDFVVIPGFDYGIAFSSLAYYGWFAFKVNPDGTLALFPVAKDSANQIELDNSASPPTVQFKNVTINFDPGSYQGSYRFDNSTPTFSPITGPFSLVLLPDTKYEMRIGSSRVGYYVDPDGHVQGTVFGDLVNAADIFDFQGNTATFRTTRVVVVPSDSSSWWIYDVLGGATLQGPRQVTLAPNVTYRLTDRDALNTPPAQVNYADFRIASPCAITPDSGVTIQGTTYQVTCLPLANAGPDQTVNEGTPVALNGTGSTVPAGRTALYAWTQVAGPAVPLSDPASATPTFAAPEVSGTDERQTLTFQLIASDGYAASDPDVVNVTVVNVNKKPVADAGNDFPLREGATGQLNAGFSYDPDGEPIVAYAWTQTGGSSVVLQGDQTVTPAFTAPLGNQTLLFQVRVSDGKVFSDASAGTDPAAADTVQVTVGANTPPVAVVGADQTVMEGAGVQLSGEGSYDSDGDGLAFAWTQIGGPTAVALDDPTSRTPSFTAPAVGSGGVDYTFALVVTDSYAPNPKASTPATVRVHVQNANDPPRCDLARPSVASLWPPNHKMVEVGILGVTDPNVGDVVTITVTGVTQDEPVNGLGDGDTSPDAVLQGSKVLLRAERSGTGNGRVYTVHFTASDGTDSCTGIVRVSVPRDRQVPVVDDGQGYSSLQP
jgi:hypothetical protein